MKLTCPVCGYDNIQEPKLKWSICPSCGTQFGLSDSGYTVPQLRQMWIQDKNATWQGPTLLRPSRWSPIAQLRNIGYECTRTDRQKINVHEMLAMDGAVVIRLDLDSATFTLGRAPSTVTVTQSRSIGIPFENILTNHQYA